jgi:uncharacterized protein YndB with AHSA1/START domain
MKNNFKPIVGHKFQFTFVAKEGSTYSGIVDCEVLEVKPFTNLAYSWDSSTRDGRMFNSKVVWTLSPTAEGTKLQLVHSGLTVLEDILNHTKGWESCLTRFEQSITTVNK